jgi:beta-lactamase superfamily II metal-dependent hydrolase
MKVFFYILFLFFSFEATAFVDEEFYIFDVGQGNSQLAIYKKDGKNIGILYDSGSSSSKAHPKISQLKGGEWKLFFKKGAPPKKEDDIKKPIYFLFEEESVLDNKEDIDKHSESSQTISIKESISSIETTAFINKVIKEANLMHLFIILSHPDKDHINFINAKTIPQDLFVTILLNGDWLGFGGSNSKQTGLSKDIVSVLTFLKNRQNTWVEFPYYWNGLKIINKEISYKDIKKTWEDDVSEKFNETFNLCCKGTINASLDFLNLYQSLDRILSKNHDKDLTFYNHFKALNLSFDANSYYYSDADVLDILKSVKIAYVNFPFRDVNSQSCITEIKMPKLKIQFFLTGDAHEETFELIAAYNQKELFFQKEEDFISLVMLPHHGSYENKSVNIFNLFKPDIIGISAGNGAVFSHPSRRLVKELEKTLKEKEWKTKFYNSFYEAAHPNDFIYFEEIGKKHDKKQISRLHRHKKQEKNLLLHKYNDKIPFFCTNVHGTIKIDEYGFQSLFSNIIEYKNNQQLLVDYTTRIDPNKQTVNLSTLIPNDFGIIDYNNIYYYVVNNKKESFFYQASLIE